MAEIEAFAGLVVGAGMEGLYLLGFGPRTAAAARDLSVKLYPALAPQAEKFKPAALSANCRL